MRDLTVHFPRSLNSCYVASVTMKFAGLITGYIVNKRVLEIPLLSFFGNFMKLFVSHWYFIAMVRAHIQSSRELNRMKQNSRKKLPCIWYLVHVGLSCLQLISKIFITFLANVPFQFPLTHILPMLHWIHDDFRMPSGFWMIFGGIKNHWHKFGK